MMNFNSLTLLFLSLSIIAKAQHPPVFEGMNTDTTFIALNNMSLNLVKYKYGKPGINFLAIHDNEDTGVKAAFEYIRFSGGSIVDCQYGDGRNFKFVYQGEEFQTDPNSIYSKKGIPMGILKYGPVDDDVVQLLDRTAKTILEFYGAEKQGYIFTLHNNADGGFGISSYLKGYELESAADSVYVNFQMDADDLVLVTELELFNRFKKANVNVVLQSKDAPDDGSLSIYAMKNKMPYINVEVQHGHQQEHLEIIEMAIKILYETYPHLKVKATE